MSTKLTKKIVKQILDDFKEDLFIIISLKRYNVNYYDFKKFLESDQSLLLEYKEIELINNEAKEEIIAEKSLNGDFSKGIALEFIKANNKEKFGNNIQIDVNKYETMSDTDLDARIKLLTEKLKT